jgi:hypothetical protein
MRALAEISRLARQQASARHGSGLYRLGEELHQGTGAMSSARTRLPRSSQRSIDCRADHPYPWGIEGINNGNANSEDRGKIDDAGDGKPETEPVKASMDALASCHRCPCSRLYQHIQLTIVGCTRNLPRANPPFSSFVRIRSHLWFSVWVFVAHGRRIKPLALFLGHGLVEGHDQYRSARLLSASFTSHASSRCR